jgi:transcriptional regulator with XRE-family HTH domain
MDKRPHDGLKTLTYSGQILGAIVKALDVRDDVLTSRTAKRYFLGANVDQYSLKQVYVVLGQRLVDLAIVPPPLMFQEHGVSMAKIVAASLARMAGKWDRLCARIQSRQASIHDESQAINGFCRLLVVDLALRVFAWMRLSELPPPEAETPQWAEENGPGKMLRRLLSEAGITRDQFGARVEVSPVSIDNWFDGKVRPTPANIERIADAFSNVITGGSRKHDLQVRLQSEFTFAYLADQLAEVIGREAVEDLATALYRFVRTISDDVNSMKRPPLEDAAGNEFETLRLGVDEPSSHALLRNLASLETDPEWKRDILASTTGWELRFEEIALQSSLPGGSAGLAQDLPEAARAEESEDGTGDDLKRLRTVSTLGTHDYERLAFGDLTLFIEQLRDGIERRRLVVRQHQSSPRPHFELGSFLGMAGKHLRSRDLIDEGVRECRIAGALCKGWDAPLVEVGIILSNAGRVDEALIELSAAVDRLRGITPHLAFARGYALMQVKRHEEALKDFEAVIRARPEYALALDHAGHCAFMIGQNVKGREYAKAARKHGSTMTYDDWRRGTYGKHRTIN